MPNFTDEQTEKYKRKMYNYTHRDILLKTSAPDLTKLIHPIRYPALRGRKHYNASFKYKKSTCTTVSLSHTRPLTTANQSVAETISPQCITDRVVGLPLGRSQSNIQMGLLIYFRKSDRQTDRQTD